MIKTDEASVDMSLSVLLYLRFAHYFARLGLVLAI